MDSRMFQHQNNLRKSANLKPYSYGIKYEYILTEDDLINHYITKMADLNYPLRAEPKRDRLILNTQSAKKAFEDAAVKQLNQMEKEIRKWINNEAISYIEEETLDLLNNITVNNNTFVSNRRPKEPKSWATKLGEQFGKALVNGIWDGLFKSSNKR